MIAIMKLQDGCGRGLIEGNSARVVAEVRKYNRITSLWHPEKENEDVMFTALIGPMHIICKIHDFNGMRPVLL